MSHRRVLVPSGAPYEGVIGFSRPVRWGHRVMVSGTGPVWPDGSCRDEDEAEAVVSSCAIAP